MIFGFYYIIAIRLIIQDIRSKRNTTDIEVDRGNNCCGVEDLLGVRIYRLLKFWDSGDRIGAMFIANFGVGFLILGFEFLGTELMKLLINTFFIDNDPDAGHNFGFALVIFIITESVVFALIRFIMFIKHAVPEADQVNRFYEKQLLNDPEDRINARLTEDFRQFKIEDDEETRIRDEAERKRRIEEIEKKTSKYGKEEVEEEEETTSKWHTERDKIKSKAFLHTVVVHDKK